MAGSGSAATTWPRIWFKGGSEPGVLTLGYLARDHAGGTFVVIVLTEDQAQPVQESLAAEVFRASTSSPEPSTCCGPPPKAEPREH